MTDEIKDLENSEEEEDIENKPNPLDMSDEDFMEMSEPPPVAQADEEPEADDTTDDDEEDSTANDETNDDDLDDTDDSEGDDEDAEDDKPDAEDDGEDSKDEEDPEIEAKSDEKEVEIEDSEDDKSDETKNTIDYKSEYEKIMSPFKAFGRQITLKSPDEVIRLMQMGADYNRKMAGLKPNLKLLKMLDNNSLLDEEKLSYLIDLDKKNPEAITKFIKESGVDPLDVDTTKDTNYKPNTYTVSDKEVELDEVLQGIEGTPSFKDTIDIISNKWDAPSKKVLLEYPTIINIINDQIGSGIFDQIMNEVEKGKMLGELTGLSDLEAYRRVGDEIHARNGFVDQAQEKQEKQTTVLANEQTPAKKQVDPKLKDRKRSASSIKTAPTKKKANNYNPLAMSDDEFEKVSANL